MCWASLSPLSFVINPCFRQLIYIFTRGLDGRYLGINKPETLPSFVLRESFLNKVLHNLLRNSHARTTSSHKHSTLILNRDTSTLQRIDDTSQNNSARSLDIIIKARELMLVFLQCRKRVLEILKLDNDPPQKSAKINKSLERRTHPGQTVFNATINSSRNSISSFSEIFFILAPI